MLGIKKLTRQFKRFNRNFARAVALLPRLIDAIRDRKRSCRPVAFHGGEVTFLWPGFISCTIQPLEDDMTTATFTLPADTADGEYVLAPITGLVDSENSPITDFSEKFETSDPNVITVTPTDPADISRGNYHLGVPGVATVTRSVVTRVGLNLVETPIGVFTFILTAGAPVSVVEGAVDFVGLTPDPVTP